MKQVNFTTMYVPHKGNSQKDSQEKPLVMKNFQNIDHENLACYKDYSSKLPEFYLTHKNPTRDELLAFARETGINIEIINKYISERNHMANVEANIIKMKSGEAYTPPTAAMIREAEDEIALTSIPKGLSLQVDFSDVTIPKKNPTKSPEAPTDQNNDLELMELPSITRTNKLYNSNNLKDIQKLVINMKKEKSIKGRIHLCSCILQESENSEFQKRFLLHSGATVLGEWISENKDKFSSKGEGKEHSEKPYSKEYELINQILSICEKLPISVQDLKASKIGKKINNFGKTIENHPILKGRCEKIISLWKKTISSKEDRSKNSSMERRKQNEESSHSELEREKYNHFKRDREKSSSSSKFIKKRERPTDVQYPGNFKKAKIEEVASSPSTINETTNFNYDPQENSSNQPNNSNTSSNIQNVNSYNSNQSQNNNIQGRMNFNKNFQNNKQMLFNLFQQNPNFRFNQQLLNQLSSQMNLPFGSFPNIPNGQFPNFKPFIENQGTAKKSILKCNDNHSSYKTSKRVKFESSGDLERVKVFKANDEPDCPEISEEEHLKIQEEILKNPYYKIEDMRVKEINMEKENNNKSRDRNKLARELLTAMMPEVQWKPLTELDLGEDYELAAAEESSEKLIGDAIAVNILGVNYFREQDIPACPEMGEEKLFDFMDDSIPKMDNHIEKEDQPTVDQDRNETIAKIQDFITQNNINPIVGSKILSTIKNQKNFNLKDLPELVNNINETYNIQSNLKVHNIGSNLNIGNLDNIQNIHYFNPSSQVPTQSNNIHSNANMMSLSGNIHNLPSNTTMHNQSANNFSNLQGGGNIMPGKPGHESIGNETFYLGGESYGFNPNEIYRHNTQVGNPFAHGSNHGEPSGNPHIQTNYESQPVRRPNQHGGYNHGNYQTNHSQNSYNNQQREGYISNKMDLSKYKTKPCKNFHGPIGCFRGEKCHFIHDPNFAGREIPNFNLENYKREEYQPHQEQRSSNYNQGTQGYGYRKNYQFQNNNYNNRQMMDMMMSYKGRTQDSSPKNFNEMNYNN